MHTLSAQQLQRDTLPYLFVLDDSWEDAQENTYEIPFVIEGEEPLALSTTFSLDCDPPDQLYLHFSRIAWDAELELNDKYLGVFNRPFDSWTLPIKKTWLRPGANQLRVRLYYNTAKPFSTKPHKGILGKVVLLEEDQVETWQDSLLPSVVDADTVAILAAWFRNSGFLFDSTEAILNLLPLLKENIRNVHFAFPPGREFRALCRDLGFVEVPGFPRQSQLVLANAYPFEAASFPHPPNFWLDESGQRTGTYGHFPKLSENKDMEVARGQKLFFSLLILFPLLALFVVKIIQPGFFHNLMALVLNPILFLGTVADNTSNNGGLLFILLLFKLLALTTFLTLGVYYISLENQWQYLNFFSEESLLKKYFYGSGSLLPIFGKSFLFLVLWFGFKHGLILLIGMAFRVKNLLVGSLNLDIVGSYPLVFLLSVPFGFIFFTDNLWGGAMQYVLAIFLGIYLLRKAYVYFSGLDKLFAFSPGMKFLYICTFNILPYVLFL